MLVGGSAPSPDVPAQALWLFSQKEKVAMPAFRAKYTVLS